MGSLCSADSLVCKVVYGIIAVITAALICGLQRCFRKKLKKFLETDIGAGGRDADYRCSTISDRTVATCNIQGNNRVQMNWLNVLHPTHISQQPGVIHQTQHVTVLNPLSNIQVANQSFFHTYIYNSELPMPTPIPQQTRMNHIMHIPNSMEQGRNLNPSASNINQENRSVPRHINNHERPAIEQRTTDSGDSSCPNFWRFVYFCLMSFYLYDFIADAVLSSEYFVRGEFKDFILSMAPGATSVLFSIPILLYLPITHVGLPCCFGILIVVTSPLAKAMIYGWIVNIGEKSWQKRWYLQALTFLQLLEVCVEGIPQFIFEYYIFLTESQTLFQSLQSIQKWFALVSILTVSLSITSATTTLDREEDSRSVYDEKLKTRIHPADKEYHWKIYKEKNTKLWYIYFVIVYFERAFEFVPRCIIFTNFIQEFGLKSFGYFAGIYIFILLIFSVNCLRKIYSDYSNDTCIKPLIIISTIVGAFANLFFCYEWLFRFQWTKKDLYIRYYALFYIVNLALCIANTSFAGGLTMYLILFPTTVIPQIILLLLRIHLRQKMKSSIS